ncbi:hypothetical protein ABXR19_16040, partial [Uliginosibacterium flavum]
REGRILHTLQTLSSNLFKQQIHLTSCKTAPELRLTHFSALPVSNKLVISREAELWPRPSLASRSSRQKERYFLCAKHPLSAIPTRTANEEPYKLSYYRRFRLASKDFDA